MPCSRVLIEPLTFAHDHGTASIMDQTTGSHSEAFLFTAKAAISAVLAVLVFDFFGLPGDLWAAISAVIVTQPSLHPSVKASLTRVVAKLIGAFTGAALSTILGQSLLAQAIGVQLTGLICHFTRLDDAARPAYAAVVIVIFATGKSVWSGSLDRVFAVLIGCLCALAVGFVFDKASNTLGMHRKPSTSVEKSGD
jgi:uncharacterized membrane protein YgaE (UPF0421/DUF939 family)